MTRASFLLLIAGLALAACERQPVNPQTEPAAPVAAPPVGPPAPRANPATFVGRWAADADWCRNATGPQRPIEITLMRFEGYENSCAITSMDQVQNGYDLTLACEAEGAATRERVRLSMQDDALRLTWLNRNDTTVVLTRCPAAPVTPPAAP